MDLLWKFSIAVILIGCLLTPSSAIQSVFVPDDCLQEALCTLLMSHDSCDTLRGFLSDTDQQLLDQVTDPTEDGPIVMAEGDAVLALMASIRSDDQRRHRWTHAVIRCFMELEGVSMDTAIQLITDAVADHRSADPLRVHTELFEILDQYALSDQLAADLGQALDQFQYDFRLALQASAPFTQLVSKAIDRLQSSNHVGTDASSELITECEALLAHVGAQPETSLFQELLRPSSRAQQEALKRAVDNGDMNDVVTGMKNDPSFLVRILKAVSKRAALADFYEEVISCAMDIEQETCNN